MIVDSLSELEKKVLQRIRQVTIREVFECNPKDIQIVRDKVVGRMCDEDKNFARFYMSKMVKDMRALAIRRGQSDEPDHQDNINNDKRYSFLSLEGGLFQLFKKLCLYIECD